MGQGGHWRRFSSAAYSCDGKQNLVNHLKFNDIAQEITWSLTSNKSDPQALGTPRTWGCLCGPPRCCPFHLRYWLISESMLWVEDEECSMAETFALPLFPTRQRGLAKKAKYVETFETVIEVVGVRTLLTGSGYAADTPSE